MIDPQILLVLGVVVWSLAGGALSLRVRERRLAGLGGLAEELHLNVERSDATCFRMSGTHLAVQVAVSVTFTPAYQTSIVVRGPRAPDPAVRLSRQNFALGPASTELQLGDRRFDARVYLEGYDDRLAAMLHAQARTQLLALLEDTSVVVEDGRIELTLPNDLPAPERLASLVRRSCELYRSLGKDLGSVPERLLHNAELDPVPEVRLTNLRLLLSHHGASDAGRRAANVAMEADDPELRVLGASRLAEGAARALAAMVADASLPGATRLRALEFSSQLREAFDAELPRLLQCTAGPVRAALVERVGQRHLLSLRPALEEIALQAEGVEALGLCRAFLAFGQRAAEPHLIRFLGDDSAEVQRAAALALAALGSVAAVEALLPLTSGVLRSTGVKNAARGAIDAIQSRLKDADAGQLSLVSPAAADGELSLMDEAGELSLPGPGS